MYFNYLVDQPKNLERLALVKLAEWITSEAEKWMTEDARTFQKVSEETHAKSTEESLSIKIETIRSIIESNVPRTLHDELFILLIKAMEKLQKKIKFNWSTDNYKKFVHLRITGILFTKYVTTLRINYAAMVRLKIPLFSKAYLLSGLTRLEFRFCQGYFDSANETEIVNALKSLPNLKDFALQRVFTHTILNCLLEHCKFIERLDLVYSKEINDTSIPILTQFVHLKNVNLNETSVTKCGIAHLLTSCKNIEVIDNYWSNKIALAVENIASVKENSGVQFQLKSYSNHCDTTYTQLKYVVQMCTQIQKIELKKNSMQGSLGILKNLPDLKELMLENFDFHGDGISEVLEASGHKLKQLRLIDIEQIDFNALIYVCKMCPNLETLFISCNIMPYTYSNHKEENALENVLLKNLKTLVYHSHRTEFYSADKEFIFLLSNCPNIEFIRSSVFLTDDIMLKVFDKNPLIYLQKFKTLNSDLSVAVIDRLVHNCYNPPVLINNDLYSYFTRDGIDGNEF